MSVEESNKEFIRNVYAEVSSGRGQAFLDAMADDVRYTCTGSTPYSRTYVGKQDLRAGLTVAVAAAVVALTVLAGGGLASSGTALKGPPIKTMTISPVNYNGPSFKNILESARIAVAWLNAHGGINGRPISVILCDER